MTTEMPAGSFFDRRANRRDEREFARQVEAAFTPDPAAIARVRVAVLAQAPQLVKVQPRHPTRWSVGTPGLRTMALAFGLVLAVAAGLAIADLRSAPAGSIAGGATPSAAASAATANSAPADLDESEASLATVLTTARSGNAATLTAVLASYQTDLKTIAADLRRPGADLSAARARLVTQAAGLSSIAASVTSANAAIYRQVSSDLTALIASLPVPAAPTPTKPGTANGGGTPTPPTPTDHPGNGNGNSSGNGNAGGNGNGNAGGNGNGNAGGNGNGNAGGNGNGNGNGHSKAR